jgi:anti-anti-sigma factor
MGVRELSVSALANGTGPCAVVSLAGRAAIGDCGWVRLLLEQQAAQGPGRVVVDLSRLSSMDWWVALMLLWAARVVSRRGGLLVLASPQPAVARLLASARAADVVDVCGSVEQASKGAVVRPPVPAS